MMLRIGQGYDVHRFAPGRPLKLGGVEISSEMGLSGHSDADVLIHAVIDAILGATGLADIGTHFPDTDDSFAGATGEELIHRTREMIADWRIVNVDTTIITEVPRIGPHREAIRDSLASLLDILPESVGIKAKTNEGLDAIGNKAGIACLAVVLLERNEEDDAWV